MVRGHNTPRALPDIPHIWVPVRRDQENMLGWFAWIWGAAQRSARYTAGSRCGTNDNASIILLGYAGVDGEVRTTNTAHTG